jgi:uncharacterized protein YgbK (DUF1537 family)
MLLGCIADDLTGATDLALMLSRGGMRVVQVMGVPETLPDADAIVVALKSRTIPAAEAVDLSLASARALLRAGAAQLYFKYCSTFDSTDQGNIGPVTGALMELLGSTVTIACPAFPENGRTIFKGHLFVGDRLLSDSPMRDHPLTPMRNSNLVEVLQRQTTRQVGLIQYDTVEQGPDAVRAALSAGDGGKIFIVDALRDAHLRTIGTAIADLRLITGGSGIALGLPENFRRSGKLRASAASPRRTAPGGRAAILAGSCSAATQGQVAAAIASGMPACCVSPTKLADGSQSAEEISAWAISQPPQPVLIYSTAAPGAVKSAQAALGTQRAADIVEQAFAAVARALVRNGFSRLIVAGGETSGAVVQSLGVRALAIGDEIDPGVPWTYALDGAELALALKSGNFGAADFFTKAWAKL